MKREGLVENTCWSLSSQEHIMLLFDGKAIKRAKTKWQIEFPTVERFYSQCVVQSLRTDEWDTPFRLSMSF
jgi:hypothetical protein